MGLGGCCRNPSLNYITMVIFKSAEYGRTRRDLVRAELILAACTVCNTIFYRPVYGCIPIERLSIKRMQDFGAFPAVLDDLNFKFSRGNMPPDPPIMFMLYHSVHSKERLQTRLQTNCQSIHSHITSPYWWESKSVSKGCRKWENREVRIYLAKNIMATTLKVRCKPLCRPNAAVCNATKKVF